VNLTLTPESLNALVDQAADLGAKKVEERMWPRFMDVAAAARYTSLSEKAISNRCRDGRIHARKIGGGWSIARAELDRYMERGRP
jgi:excisionase family DNA binding protein